jgi:hypothetical protein
VTQSEGSEFKSQTTKKKGVGEDFFSFFVFGGQYQGLNSGLTLLPCFFFFFYFNQNSQWGKKNLPTSGQTASMWGRVM